MIFVFAVPLTTHAVVRYSRAGLETITASFDNITDIDGCDVANCTYWQIHFEEEINGSHVYYSSDPYPVMQTNATFTFNLHNGKYTDVFLRGYQGSLIGNCGYQPDTNSDICPDGKHVIDTAWGLKVIDDPTFILFPFVVTDATTTLSGMLTPVIADTLINVPTTTISTTTVSSITSSSNATVVGTIDGQEAKVSMVFATDSLAVPITPTLPLALPVLVVKTVVAKTVASMTSSSTMSFVTATSTATSTTLNIVEINNSTTTASTSLSTP